MKKILLLSAGYGEGHNAAARGIRDALARVAPQAEVQLRDLFAERFGPLHLLVRKAYLTLIDRWPHAWGHVYRWLDRQENFDRNFARFSGTRKFLADLIASFQPDVVVSVYPAYPYFLARIAKSTSPFKSVIVITDSITVNRIWYRARADYFLVPNERSAEVLRADGIASGIIKSFGFPVSPKFADCGNDRRNGSRSG